QTAPSGARQNDAEWDCGHDDDECRAERDVEVLQGESSQARCVEQCLLGAPELLASDPQVRQQTPAADDERLADQQRPRNPAVA
ncbi:MAG: hypothetical protein ACRDQB_17080, partial [Thermocrispum sp.]